MYILRLYLFSSFSPYFSRCLSVPRCIEFVANIGLPANCTYLFSISCSCLQLGERRSGVGGVDSLARKRLKQGNYFLVPFTNENMTVVIIGAAALSLWEAFSKGSQEEVLQQHMPAMATWGCGLNRHIEASSHTLPWKGSAFMLILGVVNNGVVDIHGLASLLLNW